jgi:hypothetical protein
MIVKDTAVHIGEIPLGFVSEFNVKPFGGHKLQIELTLLGCTYDNAVKMMELFKEQISILKEDQEP